QEEPTRVVLQFKQTQSENREASFFHQMFERTARRFPDTTALVASHSQMTYGALNRWSNQLAHELRSYGVGPEVLVAVCLDRSIDLLVAVLGVLKAGGAFLPLDPA